MASGDAGGNRGDHLPADSARGFEKGCSDPPETPVSKNALRKLRRQQWLTEAKGRRRALRADAKRLKKKLKREALGSKKEAACGEPANDAGLTLRICVDCDYEDLQGESEIFSLVQQLMYAYGDANRLNRHRDKASGTRRRWKSGWRTQSAEPVSITDATENCSGARASTLGPLSLSQTAPAHDCKSLRLGDSSIIQPEGVCNEAATAEEKPAVEFCITGVGPKVKEALKRVQCNGRWKCEVCAVPFDDKFSEECAKGQAVYLTADADEELDTLDPDTVYIVGGLVDRNRYKGLTLKRSRERGVKTAKLPIASRLGRKLEGSKILTVNQASGSTQSTLSAMHDLVLHRCSQG
ncbi:hypothetical protein ACSSS7_006741 [Eimeria intestinalis]